MGKLAWPLQKFKSGRPFMPMKLTDILPISSHVAVTKVIRPLGRNLDML